MNARNLFFRRWPAFALLGVLLCAVLPVPAAPPAKVELAYEVLRNGSAIADVATHFEQDGTTYRISEEWKGRGLLALRGEARRSSRGSVGAAGLRPLEYTDQRGRSDDRARFDWTAKTVQLSRKGETRTLPLPTGAQDRLSFNLNFLFGVPGGRSFTAAVADGRDLSEHVYEVAGAERLKAAGADIDTVRLVRRKADAGDRGVEIWIDRTRLVPVRMLLIEKDGTRLDQIATKIQLP